MYTLYHHGSSVCAGKVRLALDEKGLPWTGIYIDILKGDQFTPDYLELNPKAVVPTLVDNGKAIAESTVINEYLDKKHPETSLHPADPYDFYKARLWTKAVDEDLHPACAALTFMCSHRHTIARLGPEGLEKFLSATPAASVTADWKEKKRMYVTRGLEAPDGPDKIRLYDRYLHAMEEALKDGPWLVGKTYGISDLSLTPYVNRLAMLSMSDMWENGRLPRVADWWRRICERPSFKPMMLDWVPQQLTKDLRDNGAKSWPDVARILNI
ncbi:MAG: glutathione S-transferase family protein [Beijerinckiaceae bacterium]